MSKRVHWASHRIKGAYYYRDSPAFKQMAKDFAAGKTLTVVLKREPTNRHDANAIRVLAPDSDILIGFVPKDSNQQLCLVMDNYGARVTATVTKDSNFSTNMLYMDIFLEPEAPKASRFDDEDEADYEHIKSAFDSHVKVTNVATTATSPITKAYVDALTFNGSGVIASNGITNSNITQNPNMVISGNLIVKGSITVDGKVLGQKPDPLPSKDWIDVPALTPTKKDDFL